MQYSEDNVFSIPSPYTPEFFSMRQSMFSKDKYKDFKLIHKKSIYKFHSLLFNDPELKNLLELTSQTEEIRIPEEIPPKVIPLIIEYFYYKEIKSVPLAEIFDFMKIILFFDLQDIKEKILCFLEGVFNSNENNVKNAVFMLGEIYKFVGYQQIFGVFFLDLLRFFNDSQYYQEFLNIFSFDENMKTLDFFHENVKIMKALKFNNEKIMDFLSLFKEKLPLVKEIIEESLDFSTLSLKELETFSLDIMPSEIKELNYKRFNDHIMKNEEKILVLTKENIKLNQTIDKIKQELNDYSMKNNILTTTLNQISKEKALLEHKFEQTTLQNNKDLIEIKLKIKEVDLINHPFHSPDPSDKFNYLIFKTFKQNLPKKTLFDSLTDTMETLPLRISGQKNVVFQFETKENQNFGFFYSIKMPKPFSEDRFYKDPLSFLFDFNKGEAFKAVDKEEKQLRTFKGYAFCFGDSKQGDGVEFRDLKGIMIGKKTGQYEGENLFGFEKRELKTLHRVIIYKLIIDIEENFF